MIISPLNRPGMTSTSCFRIFLCISLLLSANSVFSQKDKVSIDVKNARPADILKAIDQQVDYRLFYDTAELDTARMDISASQQPLFEFLDHLFQGTELTWSVDRQRHVFIVKGESIVTDMPAGPAGKKNTTYGSGSSDSLRDYLNEVAKAPAATLENRLYVIGQKQTGNPQGMVTVAGYARDAKTGEPIPGASIYVENPRIGVYSDQYGYFSISLPRGRHTLNIQSVGMKDTKRQLLVYSEGKINIDLYTQVATLKKVFVSAEKASNIKRTDMGVQKLDIKTIKQVPVVFGEADILRVITTLPGVKTVGEASTGLNVRGGAPDQNLILFNDATIYNSAHFFGLFSAFNPEVVKDVELYKSSIPARFGGRLSSVLDITSREGNKKEWTGSAGIGLLTSRFNVEGPLVKDKTSIILGARTTYADWLLNELPAQYKNSKASFYDANLIVSHEINKKNSLYLTAYISQDHFNLNNDTTYGYGNKNISLKWKHIYSNKLNSVFTGGYDHYNYNIYSTDNPLTAYRLRFDIAQAYFRTQFNYYLSASHTLEFGASSLRYKLHPGSYDPHGTESLIVADTVPAEQALESAAYLSDHYTVNSSLSLDGGIRYSMYSYLGPGTVNKYAPGLPVITDNLLNTTNYKSGAFIKTNGGPEFRVSARYLLTDDLSLKAGYNTQRQYIHSLSNTTAMAPTDIWKLSDPNIKPQYGDQVSLGLYRNFKNNTIETSVEVYYKRIEHYLDYKSGAELIMNHHIETDVLETKGKAYGVELLIKKQTGKINGWFSYTWSRTMLRQDDPNAGELINGGKYYPANYDIPHSATLVGNYRFTHRVSVSLNATYATGRPITLPIGLYYYAGSYRTLYSDRNAYRIPYYFRTDFSMNVDGNHKVHQKFHGSWTFGVYNITGRRNPYSVYYVSENGQVNGYKLSIFGSAIPFVNYNIKFN